MPELKATSSRSFWVVLLQNRNLLIVSAILGAALLFLYAKTLPEAYEATATVLPPERTGSGGMLAFLASSSSALDLLKSATGGENPALDLYKTIIESRTMSEDVEKDSTIHAYFQRSDTTLKGHVDRLRGSLKSEALRTGMFTVTVKMGTGRFPTAKERDSARMMTAYIANAFVNALDRYNRERLMTSARATRIFIEGEYHNKMAALDSAYARLQAFQEEHKAISLPEQLTATVSAAAKIAAQIQQTEMQIDVEQHELGANSPRLKLLREQADAAKSQLAKFDDGGAGDYIIALRNAPALSRELAGLLRETKVLEQVCVYLRQQFEEQRINEERDLPSLQVLDKAQTPLVPVSPNKKLYALAGLLLGLLGSVAYIRVSTYVRDVRERPGQHWRIVNVARTVRHGKRATLLEPMQTAAGAPREAATAHV
jgi:tyrosine-protein kinase Etk/Wzc